ncbi:MAG: flagellar biosynthetic protein FliO, partial [Pseudomonadota bacterium]
ARRMQAGRLLPGGGARIANVVETQTLAPGLRLAVVEFAGRRVLLGLDRQGMKTLASDDRGPA